MVRYPNNAVLRLLTPQSTCRRLDIFPVKVTQDAIYVDVTSSSRARITRGGADSSAGRDNVYAIEPRSYLQGQNPAGMYLPEKARLCLKHARAGRFLSWQRHRVCH